MSKILDPVIDYVLKNNKVSLTGETREKAKKGIVIHGSNFHDLYKWNKQDPQCYFKHETELEVWSKIKEIHFPKIMVDSVDRWEEKLSKKGWWSSIPVPIKFSVLLILIALGAILYYGL